MLVHKDAFPLLPNLDADPQIIALRAVDPASFQFGFEQDVTRIEIAQTDPPRVFPFRQYNAASIVEVEPQSMRPLLRRQFRRRRICALYWRRGCRRRHGLRRGLGQRRLCDNRIDQNFGNDRQIGIRHVGKSTRSRSNIHLRTGPRPASSGFCPTPLDVPRGTLVVNIDLRSQAITNSQTHSRRQDIGIRI